MEAADNQYKRSLLYYPTIRIPSKQWLKLAALYWDEVSSIVPKNYNGKWLVKKSPDLEYLVGEGEFYPLDPKHLINHWHIVHDMVDELKSTIESDLFQSKVPALSDRVFDSQIHLDKIRYEVLNYLIEKGLAKEESPKGQKSEQWAYFERTTALLYMSLLAKYLAKSDDRANILTTPGTDRAEYQFLTFSAKPGQENEVGLDIKLKHFLPLPGPTATVQEIVAFKRKRYAELMRLQLLMASFEKQVKEAKSLEDAKEVAFQFDREKQLGVDDLRACLKDAKLETRAGGVSILMGISASPLSSFCANKLTEALQIADPLVTGGITLITAASVSLGAYLIGRQMMINEKFRSSPYSYLVHGEEEGIFA